MVIRRRWGALLLVSLFLNTACLAATADVRLKDLGRFLGWRDNLLTGYGIVTGLAGSGDSPRNQATRQALVNALSQFDVIVNQDQLQSRNVAAVMVTGTLSPAASVGDKLDITVTSAGDARSLAGGTLIMTPLRGPDRVVYALAQGQLSVGGYRYDANGNLQQKNHPTVGMVPAGATVERAVTSPLNLSDGKLMFVLKDADATTADRIAQRINQALGSGVAVSRDAQTIAIRSPGDTGNLNSWVSRIEQLTVAPDHRGRVVVNERTGIVVAGGDVQIGAVAISHGDIRISVETDYSASQPEFTSFSGVGVRSLVIANSDLKVTEAAGGTSVTFPNTTVANLVQTLSRLKVSTRDVISILQSIKAAGALHADIIVQ